MATETFIPKKFSPNSVAMIGRINEILKDYEDMGFTLSLRQLYYQLVARASIENSEKSYKNIGGLVSDARLAGLVDWGRIEDRGRETVINNHWNNPGEIVRAAARQFRIDKWKTQAYHIEIMVEKDALSGVLLPLSEELDIGLTANKGYCSSSTMYEIGKRLRSKNLDGQEIVVIYLGDHDPSGIDMGRDVLDRLSMFSGLEEGDLTVERIALNYDQVQKWSPPPNPAKMTDSRFASYRDIYGVTSWELDAVDPIRLAGLVRTAVDEYRDMDAWKYAVDRENVMRKELFAFADNYPETDDNDDLEENED